MISFITTLIAVIHDLGLTMEKLVCCEDNSTDGGMGNPKVGFYCIVQPVAAVSTQMFGSCAQTGSETRLIGRR